MNHLFSLFYFLLGWTAPAVFAWSETLTMKMTAMGVFGVGYGFFFTSYSLMIVDVLGLPMLQPMLSVVGLFKSMCFLTLGPMIGNYPHILCTIRLLMYHKQLNYSTLIFLDKKEKINKNKIRRVALILISV